MKRIPDKIKEGASSRFQSIALIQGQCRLPVHDLRLPVLIFVLSCGFHVEFIISALSITIALSSGTMLKLKGVDLVETLCLH